MLEVAKLATWCALVGLVGMLMMFRGLRIWMDPNVKTGYNVHLVPVGIGMMIISAGVTVFEIWRYALLGVV